MDKYKVWGLRIHYHFITWYIYGFRFILAEFTLNIFFLYCSVHTVYMVYFVSCLICVFLDIIF